MVVHSYKELIAYAQGLVGNEQGHALFVNCRGVSASRDEIQRVNQWLRGLPVPSVALGSGGDVVTSGFDMVAAIESELATIDAAVIARPKASAILVQTTRMTAELPIASALVVESLGYATLQAGSEFAAWLQRQPVRIPKLSADELLILGRSGSQLSITLNHPENRNALSVSMRDALTEAFTLVSTDHSIVTVNVEGEGPCFSAGGDLSEFGSCQDVSEAHQIRQRCMPANALAMAADRYTFHLHGACIGAGIELPAFAGRVVAKPNTYFRLPEVDMGLIPGAGGCVSIPRRIGRQRTNWLAITGIELNAETALAWGLIDAVMD